MIPNIMKFTFSIFFLFFIFLSATSQRQILYDLDSYKQVNFERRALNVFPSGGFSVFDQVNVDGETTDLSVRLLGGMNYSSIVNSKGQQKSQFIRADVNISEASRVDINAELITRKYDNGSFILIGYDVGAEYRHPSRDGTQEQFTRLGGIAKLGIGKGRIELINSVWLAVGLFQTLENAGLLLNIPTNDQITTLADIIGVERGKRYYDFRLRQIRVLESISEFLIKNGFIDITSVKSTILIQDAMRYDFNQNRRSGSRIDAIFSPRLIASVFDRNINFGQPAIQVITWQTGFDGELSFTKISNFDVHWSRSIYYGGKIEMYLGFDNEEEFTSLSLLRPVMFYDFGYTYFPNVRNNFTLRVYSDISIMGTKQEGQDTKFSSAILRSSTTASYNRYFSPRTLASITLSLGYNDPAFQDGDFQPRINGSVSFGITHSIY